MLRLLTMNRLTVAQAKKACAEALAETSPSPLLDADCLLQHVLNLDKTHLLLSRDRLLSEAEAASLSAALEKRKTGLPIAYITGHKEFFGYDFFVTQAVLIPKPDTELLVELTIAAVEDKIAAHPGSVPTVLDICTGSGCVGISVMRALIDKGACIGVQETGSAGTDSYHSTELETEERPTLPDLTLADISCDALAVARKNAQRLLGESAGRRTASGECLHFVQSNLFENIPRTFDIITTNPPYVPGDEARSLLTDGRGEPLLALDGDVTETGDRAQSRDGLSLIRRLIPQAYSHLAGGGVLLMETGEYNAEEAARLCEEAGFHHVHIERDMNEQLRVVCGVK